MVPAVRGRACETRNQVSAPFQLVPAPRSFLPLQPRVSNQIRSWPAPEVVALRRSNTWPAPTLDTLAWADSAFEPAAPPIEPVALLRLPAPTADPVSFAAPFAAPPTPLPAPEVFAAPAPLAAPPASSPRALAPPIVSLLLAPPPLAPPTLAPPAPAPLPPPGVQLAPPPVEVTPAPAPEPTPPAAPLPTPADAPVGADVDVPAPATDVTVADVAVTGDIAPTRTRRPIVRLQDAIITLSVAAATALITLVLLSQF